MPSHVAVVQAERELVHVAVEVPRADVVVRPVEPALHHRPDALDSVRRDVAAHVLVVAVDDDLVTVVRGETRVGTVLIGVDHRARRDVRADRGLQRRAVGPRDRVGLRAAPALPYSDDGGFAAPAYVLLVALVDVLVLLLAADVGLVHLDDPAQGREVATAGLAQALQHEPGGLLGDTEFLRELHAGDALPG